MYVYINQLCTLGFQLKEFEFSAISHNVLGVVVFRAQCGEIFQHASLVVLFYSIICAQRFNSINSRFAFSPGCFWGFESWPKNRDLTSNNFLLDEKTSGGVKWGISVLLGALSG